MWVYTSRVQAFTHLSITQSVIVSFYMVSLFSIAICNTLRRHGIQNSQARGIWRCLFELQALLGYGQCDSGQLNCRSSVYTKPFYSITYASPTLHSQVLHQRLPGHDLPTL